MQTLQRHDLLQLSAACITQLHQNLSQSDLEAHHQMAGWLSSPEAVIPAIVRRRALCDTQSVGVGFSFPQKLRGNRLRYATSVGYADIQQVITPWQIITPARLDGKPYGEPLNCLLESAGKLSSVHGRIGVYGATALEMVTGLPYVDSESDIDLVVEGYTLDELHALKDIMEAISLSATQHPKKVIFDTEVIVEKQWGIKLKELTSSQKTVLAKSINQVEILRRDDPIICRLHLPYSDAKNFI